MPPLVLGRKRKGDAGNVAAPVAGTRHSVRPGQHHRGRENGHHAQNQAEIAQECALELGPEGIPVADPKKSRGEPLDRGKADAKAVQKSPQVGKVVDKGGESQQTIDDNVHGQPQQDAEMPRSRVVVRGGLQKEQVPVEANVGHAPPDQAKDPSRGPHADKAGQANRAENVPPDGRNHKEDRRKGQAVGLFDGSPDEIQCQHVDQVVHQTRVQYHWGKETEPLSLVDNEVRVAGPAGKEGFRRRSDQWVDRQRLKLPPIESQGDNHEDRTQHHDSVGKVGLAVESLVAV
mmetsp:Transcript_9280/g.27650  ORF Transcript_9280/g.27650 Transcript_9280/m.27650 type:complete len:289 (+) Transcript_9280:719-1585(+)